MPSQAAINEINRIEDSETRTEAPKQIIARLKNQNQRLIADRRQLLQELYQARQELAVLKSQPARVPEMAAAL
jgi:hypothetical protein